MRHLRPLGLCSAMLSLFLAASVPAAPLTPGSLLVVTDDSFDQTFDYYVIEYSLTGVELQRFLVPQFGCCIARDATVDAAGRVHVSEGTASIALDTLDPATGAWVSRTVAGWGTNNNFGHAGVAFAAGQVLATDAMTGTQTSASQGLVRFPAGAGAGDRPVAGRDYFDVVTGLDGSVYALDAQGGPDGVRVDVLDPFSLAVLRSITLPAGLQARGIAVDAAGRIFVAGWQNAAYRLSPTGVLEQSVSTASFGAGLHSVIDIELDAAGHVALGTRDGTVILTDASFALTGSRLLPLSAPYTKYVAFVPGAPVPARRSSWGAVKTLYR